MLTPVFKKNITIHEFREQPWRFGAEKRLPGVWRTVPARAEPGSQIKLEIKRAGGVEKGQYMFILPFDTFKESTPKATTDCGEWAFHFPVLECEAITEKITLDEFSVPMRPGKMIIENYHVDLAGTIHRLADMIIQVSDTPAVSVELYLGCCLRDGKLRLTIAAEQAEEHSFLPDPACNDEVKIRTGAQSFPIKLQNGLQATEIAANTETQTHCSYLNIYSGSNLVDIGFLRDLPGELYWGDLHAHSRESDGAETAAELIRRARDWKNLDFFALNEHIEQRLSWTQWGPEKMRRLCSLYDERTKDGEFVVIGGFEFRSYCNLWCFSHEYTDFAIPEFTAFTPPENHDTTQETIRKFTQKTDWMVGYHRLENLENTLGRLPVPVHMLQMAHYKRPPEIGSESYLLRGDRSAFFGGTDTHTGIPAQVLRGPRDGQSGLTAVIASELSRGGLYRALKARHCYATMGSRTLMSVSINNLFMGDEARIPSSRGDRMECRITLCGKEEIVAFELVDNGKIRNRIDVGKNRGEWQIVWEKPDERYHYHFIRVHLLDGRMLWSSPIWI